MFKIRTIVFYIIIGVFVIIPILFGLYIHFCTSIELSNRFSIYILLSTTALTGISVILWLMNFYILRSNYLSDVEPSLLIQVPSKFRDEKNNIITPEIGFTQIHYKNTSTKTFTDLRIYCLIIIDGNKYDFSNLFHFPMYLASKDSRNREFNFIEELKKRSFNKILSKKNNVFLDISFSFSFLGIKKNYPIQKYKYIFNKRVWEII